MAVQFERTPRVTPGEPVSSSQLAGLANAINGRLLSGLGDPTFRLRQFWLGAFRNLRNPDSSGFLYPATAEFFERYQMLPPEAGEWPATGPGLPEGINVSHPFGAYLYGHEGADVDDEATALNQVPISLDGVPPSTPLEFWEIAKRQRGAFDPDTGAENCPAWEAARRYANIRVPWWSMLGKSYGDWLPSPDLLATPCDDPDTTDGYPAPPNLEIKFSALHSGVSDTTFDGTCQPGPSISPSTKYNTHVAGIIEDDLAYYVVIWDGTVYVLSREDYLEGPYDGPARLAHTDGQQLLRGLHAFAREFRGTLQNGYPGTVWRIAAGWNADAFDAQRFLTTQHRCAPQRGREIAGILVPDYRGGRWLPDGNLVAAPGAQASLDGGVPQLDIHADCVTTGYAVQAVGLARPTRIECVSGGAVVGVTTLTPQAGQAEALTWFGDHADHRTLAWRLPEGAQWNDPAGFIAVESTELMAYKPRIWDLMLICRLGGVR